MKITLCHSGKKSLGQDNNSSIIDLHPDKEMVPLERIVLQWDSYRDSNNCFEQILQILQMRLTKGRNCRKELVKRTCLILYIENDRAHFFFN